MIPDAPQDNYGGPVHPNPVPAPDPAFNDRDQNLATEPQTHFDRSGWGTAGGTIGVIGPINHDTYGSGNHNATVDPYGPTKDSYTHSDWNGYGPVR